MLWWLAVLAVFTALTILLLAIVFVTKLVATEERDSAWTPRVVAVVSICFVFCTVLLLPLDVSSASVNDITDTAIFPVRTLWRIVLAMYYVLLVTVIPFAMSHYDAWRPEQPSPCAQLHPALLTAFLSTVIVSAVMAAAWLALGYVDPTSATSPTASVEAPRQSGSGPTPKELISLDVFCLAVASVVGWGVLIVFAGVGLVAVPLRGIVAFARRPQPISAAQFETERLRIHTATERLLERGRRLEREAGSSPNLRARRKILTFRRDARQLQEAYEQLETCFHLSGGSVIRSYLVFVLSLVCAGTSMAWALHILLYKVAHVSPFLNNIILCLHVFFPMAATLVYAWLAFYLMLCTVIGCWTVGENLALFPVFALKMGRTMLNALLFNCILLLVSSLAVIQLCTSSFDEYTEGTTILSIFRMSECLFGVQVVFTRAPIPFLIVGLTALVWLTICPRLCTSEDDDEDDYSL